MHPAELALALRRRAPWEAADLGITMLQRWWRTVYAAHACVLLPVAAALLALGWALEAVWLAILLIWWLEPVYDRAVLFVLSRATFGSPPRPHEVLLGWREWLGARLIPALTYERFDPARSFNLPVTQLERQAGRAARARRILLGRRARGHAVWLTVVWVHFEAVLLGSVGAAAELLLPAQLDHARGADEAFLSGVLETLELASLGDALAFLGVLLFLEPFYVASGFALYLNRRTLLEGWDIEVALRRIAVRHGAALLLVAIALLAAPSPALAQERHVRQEIAEVLKAPEFGHYRETRRWQPRSPAAPADARGAPSLPTFGLTFARGIEVVLWALAVAGLGYLLWRARRRGPMGAQTQPAAYQPPPALFGLELAPESLPRDVSEAALGLAREGRLREALSLLYRGALAQLVYSKGVAIRSSHTEDEAVQLAELAYFADLVEAWQRCAYADEKPARTQVERLALEFKAAFP